MPVPTLVTDLSTTVASNSPAGSDNVFPDLDNYLRALSGFVASIRDNSGNGWVSPYLPLTYSAGTANGVVYLNGSKVVTTGSALVFDGSNLGLGVTPSANAYGSTKTFFVSGDSANGLLALSEESISATSQYVSLMNNAYPDGAGVYKYKKSSQVATSYRQNDGAHAWFTAPSGTAGTAISFTQSMTLDASGNLAVGTTTTTSARLRVDGSNGIYIAGNGANGYNVLQAQNDAATGISVGVGGSTAAGWSQALAHIGTTSNSPLVLGTNSIERARITSGGDLLVGLSAATFVSTRLEVQAATNNNGLGSKTTQNNYAPLMAWNSATTGDNLFQYFYTEGTLTLRGSIDYNRAGGLVRYNTTSDYRAKDIIGPVQNPGATIDALKVYEGKMKGATQSRPMLIAHEAQEHVPFCVSGEKDEVNEDGTPKFQQMDHASLVPLLLAEIKSLRARVAALEQA